MLTAPAGPKPRRYTKRKNHGKPTAQTSSDLSPTDILAGPSADARGFVGVLSPLKSNALLAHAYTAHGRTPLLCPNQPLPRTFYFPKYAHHHLKTLNTSFAANTD